ncbi:E motif [Dillenia turbinata]|uniref:E motif n=1 Tax=Dillenia turbinata TaxID=194707 RepID=A0AAN8UUH1_9MAGN
MKNEIAKLVSNGLYKEALLLYSQLHCRSSLCPSTYTFPYLLKACAHLKLPLQAQMLQTHLMKMGFQSNVYAATALSSMYMKLNYNSSALKAFDEMPERNLVSVNAVISGFSRNGCFREAMRVFQDLGYKGFRPNSVTLVSLLSACKLVRHGNQIHCWVEKLGVGDDVHVGTSMVTMYSNCGEIVDSRKVFELIEDKNVVTFNAFFSGLLQNGVYEVFLDVFNEMRRNSHVKANSVTFALVLSACLNLKYLKLGRQVHGLIMKTKMRFDVMVETTVVDMYAKCGCCKLACDVFKEMGASANLITWNCMIAGMMLNDESENAVKLFEQLASAGFEPDSATWNSMISGFSQLGKGDEAIKYFNRMMSAGVVPSVKSITSLLSSCSALSALSLGKEIHGHIIRNGIGDDEFISTALVDMYMKCGYPSWARQVFDRYDIKPDDPAFWNAVISGYGRNGDTESAFKIFEMMQQEKVQPCSATFVTVLSLCSHMGLVDKGWHLFRSMTCQYGVQPNLEHLGCMVDLLGRSGRLDEARELIGEIPKPSASAFSSLLGACKFHAEPELGEEMATRLSKLEPENPAPLVILSNIYAGEGRWKDVERIRKLMNDRGFNKHPGNSMLGVA